MLVYWCELDVRGYWTCVYGRYLRLGELASTEMSGMFSGCWKVQASRYLLSVVRRREARIIRIPHSSRMDQSEPFKHQLGEADLRLWQAICARHEQAVRMNLIYSSSQPDLYNLRG